MMKASSGRRSGTVAQQVGRGPSVRHWRTDGRLDALRQFAREAARLSWSRDLIELVLDELQADDLLEELVGDLRRLPSVRYPQAVAVAIALRHSWRPDDLMEVVNRVAATARRAREPPRSGPRRRA